MTTRKQIRQALADGRAKDERDQQALMDHLSKRNTPCPDLPEGEECPLCGARVFCMEPERGGTSRQGANRIEKG